MDQRKVSRTYTNRSHARSKILRVPRDLERRARVLKKAGDEENPRGEYDVIAFHEQMTSSIICACYIAYLPHWLRQNAS
jgi:hypothetical protein